MATESNDELNLLVFHYLVSLGLTKSAKKLKKKIVNKEDMDILKGLDLQTVYQQYKKTQPVKAVSSSSEDSSSDSSSSEEEEEKPVKKSLKRKETEVTASEVPKIAETVAIATENVQEEEIVQPVSKKAKKNEPKVKNAPFQRVVASEVEFIDERLRDNTFMGKGGAASSYGLKAHNDLIVTRGKGFTKEKNKKKRGSYKGGAIDQACYSIKFADSD